MDGIFQVVRAFDDAEVIHVEGDVDPLRDMEIIQTELRLKDIEWVEKALDALKKTSRALGNTSLADRAKKEEIVSSRLRQWRRGHTNKERDKAITERILHVLTVEGKDVRKIDWNNREVSERFDYHDRSAYSLLQASIFFPCILDDDKEHHCSKPSSSRRE